MSAPPETRAPPTVSTVLRNAATAARSASAAPRLGFDVQSLAQMAFASKCPTTARGSTPIAAKTCSCPFYTTRPDGNVIGLSFARQVVIAHGGSITATISVLGGAAMIMVIA